MVKTKALISFAVTASKLICVFVFAYAKSRFSHDAAQLILVYDLTLTQTKLPIDFEEKRNSIYLESWDA